MGPEPAGLDLAFAVGRLGMSDDEWKSLPLKAPENHPDQASSCHDDGQGDVDQACSPEEGEVSGGT